MDRRNHVTDTKLLENIRSRNQVETREPSSTTLTSMVTMLMCITAMETIILEVVMEGMGVAMEEAVEDMEVAVVMVMAAMTTAIKAHVVCLVDVHLSWHLMKLLSIYLTQTHSKNIKFNFF